VTYETPLTELHLRPVLRFYQQRASAQGVHVRDKIFLKKHEQGEEKGADMKDKGRMMKNKGQLKLTGLIYVK
jgi:hypothetical protein